MAKSYTGPVNPGKELWVTSVQKNYNTPTLKSHTPPTRFIAGGTCANARDGVAWRHPSNVWDRSVSVNTFREVYDSYEEAFKAYCEQIDKVIEQVENEKSSLTSLQKKYASYKDTPIKGSKKKSNLTI